MVCTYKYLHENEYVTYLIHQFSLPALCYRIPNLAAPQMLGIYVNYGLCMFIFPKFEISFLVLVVFDLRPLVGASIPQCSYSKESTYLTRGCTIISQVSWTRTPRIMCMPYPSCILCLLGDRRECPKFLKINMIWSLL